MNTDNKKSIAVFIKEYSGDDDFLLLIKERLMAGHAANDDQLIYAENIQRELIKSGKYIFTISDIPF
jgi:hypothetical protein